MYLKIEKGTKTKSYRLTDSTEKPYIMVQTSKSDSSGTTTKKSYLPLTTNSSSGLYMKVEKGTETYRPLEYKSVSGSDTYSSSSEDVGNLSSTTALTRASTSNTIYGTKVSTTKTNYQYITYSNVTVRGRMQFGTQVINSCSVVANKYTRSSINKASHYIYGNNDMTVAIVHLGGEVTSSIGFLVNTTSHNYGITTGISFSATKTVYDTVVTTTGTTYQTRSSTSGYTGISSSSYETTGWE